MAPTTSNWNKRLLYIVFCGWRAGDWYACTCIVGGNIGGAKVATRGTIECVRRVRFSCPPFHTVRNTLPSTRMQRPCMEACSGHKHVFRSSSSALFRSIVRLFEREQRRPTDRWNYSAQSCSYWRAGFHDDKRAKSPRMNGSMDMERDRKRFDRSTHATKFTKDDAKPHRHRKNRKNKKGLPTKTNKLNF